MRLHAVRESALDNLCMKKISANNAKKNRIYSTVYFFLMAVFGVLFGLIVNSLTSVSMSMPIWLANALYIIYMIFFIHSFVAVYNSWHANK